MMCNDAEATSSGISILNLEHDRIESVLFEGWELLKVNSPKGKSYC